MTPEKTALAESERIKLEDSAIEKFQHGERTRKATTTHADRGEPS